MRWQGQRESQNIEDRRGRGAARSGAGIGLGGLVLVLAVSFLTGTNPLTLLNLLTGVQGTVWESSPPSSWPIRKTPGAHCYRKWAAPMSTHSWYSLRARCGRPAEPPRLRWVLSIVPAITRCIWTSRSFKTSPGDLARPETLPKPM